MDYPIIDAHTHIEGLPGCDWQDPPEMIIKLLDEAGIAQAVVMTYVDAPMAHESYDPLRYVKEACDTYPDRLIGFARLNPAADNACELLEKAVKEWGFKGLKLHPFGYRMPVDGEPTLKLIKKAGELGVPTLLHCGDEAYTLPLQLERAAAACPESILIFGHMGGYHHVHDAIEVARRHKNVILETSATPYPDKIQKAIDELGAERILFGSDGPGCDPTIERKKIEMLNLNETQKKQIFHDNARKLFKL